MELDAVLELVRQVHPAGEGWTRSELTAAAHQAGRLSAWCEAIEARIARHLSDVSHCPERDLATATRRSTRHTNRIVQRGRTAGEVPAYRHALEDGTISGAHLDVLSTALDQVDAAHRAEFADRATALTEQAQHSTPEQFRALLAAETAAMAADHGEARLERQRRARRCRTWIDNDGMWNLHARLDPETGLELAARLTAHTTTMFTAGTIPADAPALPGPRQDYLRALAFADLMAGTAAGSGQPHLVVVYDETTRDTHGNPRIDWGLPIDLPPSALQRLSRRARIWPVEVHDGEVLAAMGQLDLERTTRIANQAQRRVLRALHPTCGVPGCDVRFDHCEVHHLWWWRHGGPTNLANLIPLCTRHHTHVHQHLLVITMTRNRRITATYTHPNAPPGHTSARTQPSGTSHTHSSSCSHRFERNSR